MTVTKAEMYQFSKWLSELESYSGLCELDGKWFMIVVGDDLSTARVIQEEYTELPDNDEAWAEFYKDFVNDGVITL